MRFEKHPIIQFQRGKEIKFYFSGDGEDKELTAYEGETVASAMISAGIKIFSHSKRYHRPRGFFCAIGKCSSCIVEIDGVPNQMACMKLVKEGMKVKRQK
jgi:sarcosine oxidase, subunit alpha